MSQTPATAGDVTTQASVRMPRGRAVLIACLIAIVPFAWLTWRFNWVVDDAFISFRYARHLAEGHGLRFNVGEAPPVEGYSNFLWVLLLTPVEALGWPTPQVSCLLSVACGLVLIWRVTGFLHMRMGLALAPLIFSALFLTTLPPLAVWATSGLAMVPSALLVFMMFEFVLADPRDPRGLAGGIAAALLILLRVDGMIWAAGIIGLAGLAAVQRQDRSAIKPLAICVAIAATTLAALTIFRLAYFGWPLPNTVYAKAELSAMTLERGVKYLLRLPLEFPHLALILTAGAVMDVRSDRVRGPGRRALLIALGGFGYAVLAGGDWMPMCRLLVPALPLVAVVFAMVLASLSSRRVMTVGCGLAAAVLSLLPAYNVHVVPSGVRKSLHFRQPVYVFCSEYERWVRQRRVTAEGTEVGLALRQHTRPSEGLISVAIGARAYYSHLVIYDRAGLVNAEVAHRRPPRRRTPAGHDKVVRPAYFVKDRPTYYWAEVVTVKAGEVLRMETGRRVRFGKPNRAFQSPAVNALYEQIGFVLPPTGASGSRKLLLLFMRRDLVDPSAKQRPAPRRPHLPSSRNVEAPSKRSDNASVPPK